MLQHILGFFTPTLVYLIIFGLNAALPGRWVTGYVTRPGSTDKLRYRLNGLLVLLVMVGAWVGLCYGGVIAWDDLYRVRWSALAGAVVFGLVFSFALVLLSRAAGTLTTTAPAPLVNAAPGGLSETTSQ